jgi:hypothetical protein
MKKKTMVLEIEDEGEFDAARLPRIVRDAQALLTNLPDGKLLRPPALAARLGVLTSTMLQHASHPALAPYKYAHRRRALFGNPRTIEAAKERYANG